MGLSQRVISQGLGSRVMAFLATLLLLATTINVLAPSVASAASGPSVSPMINTVNCGSRQDFFKAIYPGGATCWANRGDSYKRVQNVYYWQSGNNAGYFDFECHGNYGRMYFSKWAAGSIYSHGRPDDCTIYHLHIY